MSKSFHVIQHAPYWLHNVWSSRRNPKLNYTSTTEMSTGLLLACMLVTSLFHLVFGHIWQFQSLHHSSSFKQRERGNTVLFLSVGARLFVVPSFPLFHVYFWQNSLHLSLNGRKWMFTNVLKAFGVWWMAGRPSLDLFLSPPYQNSSFNLSAINNNDFIHHHAHSICPELVNMEEQSSTTEAHWSGVMKMDTLQYSGG